MTSISPGARVVVTGATGFVGKTLVEHLANSGYLVVGVSERENPPQELSAHLAEYRKADLTSGWPDVGPFDGLVHLAGLAAVGPSFSQPQQYISSNSSMVTHIFEHALKSGWNGRALIISSGAVYGHAVGDLVSEEARLEATSPYVVSKILIEVQTEYYRRQGIDAIIARPFNHIGPGQRPGFIVPDLAEKVRKLENKQILKAGNLDSSRDYTDVRDIVDAYRLLLQLPNPKNRVYNVCGGQQRSGWQVLEAICSRLETPVPHVDISGDRLIDPTSIAGDSARLRGETDWGPTIDFQTSINDFLSASDSTQHS